MRKYFLLYLSLCRMAYAQTENIKFTRLSLEEGFTARVISILQDQRGLMWFGTENGLYMYDGYEFTVYRQPPFNRLLFIYEDRSGRLWVSAWGGGLKLFDRKTKTFETYKNDPQNPSSLSNNLVRRIYEDRSGRLWVGTRGGLNLLDPKTKTFERYKNDPRDPSSLSNDSVSSIYEDRSGRLWVGTRGGLNLFDTKTKTFERYKNDPQNPSSLSSDTVSYFYEDRAGRLWVGTWGGGLNLFDAKTKTFESYKNDPQNPSSLSHNFVQHIYEDRSGRLWVGTFNGLNLFDAKTRTFESYKTDPQDPSSLSNNVVSIYEDRSGRLWVGTLGGLNLVDAKTKTEAFEWYRNEEWYNKDYNVNSFCEGRSGRLWVGTWGGGLNLFDAKTKTFESYKNDPQNPSSLSHNFVQHIYEDRSGRLWVGTRGGGLNLFDTEMNTFESYKPDPQNPSSLSNNVSRIYEDRSGRLWVGTRGGGLNLFDAKTKTFERYKNDSQNPSSLSNDSVTFIYEDHSGRLWVGTFGGLNLFDAKTKTFESYKNNPQNPSSLSDNHVTSIYEDHSGRLWVGTSAGLNLFDEKLKSFRVYAEKDGLRNSYICGILEDDHGNLWLSTNLGLSRFAPSREGFEKGFRNYATTGQHEFLNGACFKSRNGWMYFGGQDGSGQNGFIVFHPDSIKDDPYVPPVVLTKLEIFNKPVEVGNEVDGFVLPASITESDELVLSYRESVFTISFAALSYVQALKNKYAYRLEGFDKDWNYTDGKRRYATYTNLDPGDYIFRVKGSNHDGVWNEKERTLKIIITPPWWKTWWMYSVYFLGAMGFLYAVRRFELNRERQKADVKESRLRAQAAEAQSKLIELENQRKTAELEEARQLQLSMLPKEIPKLDYLDIAVHMRTATEVGGDYYDFHVDEDGTLTLVLGDATGHGLKAGHMVSTVKGLFNAYANNGQVSNALSEMSRCIKNMHLHRLSMCLLMAKIQPLPGGGSQVGAGVRLRLSSAGMPPVLIHRQSAKTVEEVLIKGLPLGAMRNAAYQECEIELDEGDTILFMSDGFPELTNETGEALGYVRAMEIFEKACEITSPYPLLGKEGDTGGGSAVIERLQMAAANWANGDSANLDGSALKDDMTFLVIRVVER